MLCPVFPQTARGEIATTTYNYWHTYANGETFVLQTRTPVSGHIAVPAGQGKLVIELVGPQPGGYFCGLTFFVTRNVLLSITYDQDFGSDFVYSFSGVSGSKWTPSGRGTYLLTIENPNAGDYYFAPWQEFYPVGSPLNCGNTLWAMKAQYFPAGPTNTRITPVQQEANLGGSASISVTATGDDLSYRWEKRVGGVITRISSSLNPSAATATLVLSGLKVSDGAEYRAVVNNTGGESTSAWSILTVRVPPTITSHPQPKKAMPGGSVTFAAVSTGTPPLTYRWEHQELNGNIRTISGTAAASLTLNNVNYLTHAGAYRVWVMNAAAPAGVASTWASLTVGPAIIGLAPQNPSVNEGASVSVTASASGTAPLVYNWFRNGQLRQSGFSGSLNLASTRESDDGTWRLDVTNLAGKVSENFNLTIIPPPTQPSFPASPGDITLTEGETLALSGQAFGSRPIAYQWFHDGAPVAGAATAFLIISNVGPEDAGQWFVRASNSLGEDATAPATVTISPGPKITRQPVNMEIPPGGSATLSAEAIGRAPLGYQWFKNGQALGITGPELTITNAALTDSGFYYVLITNGLGNFVASVPARLAVKEGAVAVGSVLWTFPFNTPRFGQSQPLVIHEDGRLVFGDWTGLTCINAEGILEWFLPLNSSLSLYDPEYGDAQQFLSAPGGITLVRGHQPHTSHRIFAISPQGQILWGAVSTNEPPDFRSVEPGYPRLYSPLADRVLQIALGASNEIYFIRDSPFVTRVTDSLLNTHTDRSGNVTALYSLLLSEAGSGSAGTILNATASEFKRATQISPSPPQLPDYYSHDEVASVAVRADDKPVFAGYGKGPLWSGLAGPQDPANINPFYDLYSFGHGYYFLDNSVARFDGHSSSFGRLERTVSPDGLRYYYSYFLSNPTVLAVGPDDETYMGDSFGPNTPRGMVFAIDRNGHGGSQNYGSLGPFLAGPPIIDQEKRLVRTGGTPTGWVAATTGLAGNSYSSNDPFAPPSQIAWMDQTPGMSSLSDPVIGADGTIYFTCTISNHPVLRALDSQGTLLWQFTCPSEGSPSFGPSLAVDGTVYFLTPTALYALKGNTPILDSSWPIRGGNVRGTWRVQQLPKIPVLASQAIPRHGTLMLAGGAAGPQPIRYQWMKDGERLPGATNGTLVVSDLLGFDGGVYQVRVSNPTGDRLSQPANLKVSFDPLPFVGVGQSPKSAFSNPLAPGNTHRDGWQFFHGINETNRTGRYSRMDFYTNVWQTAGLSGWCAAEDLLQVVGFNANAPAISALGASVPTGCLFMNPGSTIMGCVSLAYQTEIAGYYSITGRLSRLAVDASGDGVRWYLDAGALNVMAGALTNTAADTDFAIARIYLNRGELLHLIISPGSSGIGDLVGVELDVRLAEADPNSEPGFLQSPQDISIVERQDANFNAQVDGAPEPILQWQRSTNQGATWEALLDGPEVTGANTTNLQLYAASLEMSGQMFRLEAINAAGSAISGAARLTVATGSAAPAFTAQPEGIITVSGGRAILTAQANGTGPLNYQWFHDSQLLAGQTNATLTLNAASTLDTGAYYVVAENAIGSQTSAVASLTVDLLPSPPRMSVVGTTNGPEISLGSVAGSSWEIQRSSVPGPVWETVASGIANISGSLSVVDSNAPSAHAFYRAKLNIPATLPEITIQPSSVALKEGGNGALSVTVEGARPLSFQWWKDGEALNAETNQAIFMSGVVSNRAGNYVALVSNGYGTVTSQVAVVTVAAPPTFFKVENIFATATSELKLYNRVLGNLFSDIARQEVWESVGLGFGDDRSPAITFDLQGIYRLGSFRIWNGPEFDPSVKRMLVEYSRDGVQFDSFDEMQVALATQGVDFAGESFDLESIEARYVRFVFLENYAGQVFPVVGAPSAWSLVMVDQVEFYGEFLGSVTPEILTQPESVTNCLPGISISLGVTAKGTPPITYQWWHDAMLLGNATNPALALGPLTLAAGGQYSVVVSNAFGSIVSTAVSVTVATNATALPLSSFGLLAYYSLDNTTNDLSGNGRHAHYFGGKLTRDRHGVLGGAFAFTNSSSYLTVNNLDPDNYPDGFSFGCWFRPEEGFGNGNLLYWYQSGNYGQTYLQRAGSDGFHLRCGSGSPSTDHGVSGLVTPLGEWQHALVTHGTGFDRLYLNGTQVGAWPTLPLLNNDDLLYIGNDSQASFDDVTIFSRELSANEVMNLYNGQFPPPPIVAPVRLQSPAVIPGGFSFTLTADTGTQFAIQMSTNLVQWGTVRVVTIPATGTTNIVESIDSGNSRRFYRVLKQ